MSHTLIMPEKWYAIGGYKVLFTDRGRIWYAKIYSGKDLSTPLMMLDAPTKPEIIRNVRTLLEKTTGGKCRYRTISKDIIPVDIKKSEPKKMKKVEKVKDVKVIDDFCIYPSDITELKTIGYACFIMLMIILAVLIY